MHHHGHPDHPRDHSDDVASWIERLEDPTRHEWQKPEALLELLALRPGMRVVDVGAGTGYFSRRFAAAVGPEGEALALDTNRGLLDHAAQRAAEEGLASHRTRVVEPEDPALAPASQDRIFLCNVLHHVEPRIPFLERLVEALKPGGWLVLAEFVNHETPVGPPVEMRLDPAILRGELEGLGLAVEEHSFPYQYVLIARRR